MNKARQRRMATPMLGGVTKFMDITAKNSRPNSQTLWVLVGLHMDLIGWLGIVGTFAFAMSGALAAIDKKLDMFGMLVIAFVTALGGGTLRDVLLGDTPVGWMLNPGTLLFVLAGAGAAYVSRQRLAKVAKTLFLFDAIGIAVFTILGLEKTLSLGFSPLIAVMMGCITAVFGGVIRDILCNEIPLIFRQEIYAVACVVGGAVYLVLQPMFDQSIVLISTITLILLLRVVAVKFRLHLPVL